MTKYTKEMVDYLREITPGRPYKVVAEMLNEKFSTDFSESAVGGALKRYGIKNGLNGKFKKGHESFTKGKKMPEEVYEKCKKGMFKPGNVPPQYLPVGTEKMLGDGYIWVKVNDIPKVPKNVNWRQKQRVVWEQAYGPIPEGCMITFLDGDHTNFELDNLAMITRAENVRMNQNRLYSTDKELTKTGIAVAKLIVAKNQRKKGRNDKNN